MRTCFFIGAVAWMSFAFMSIVGIEKACADDLLIHSMTLDDYTDRAIQKGIDGKKTSMALETAGYTREIALRQTDSPTLALSHTHTRGETKTGSTGVLSDDKSTALTLNETTPWGTSLNTVGTYGDSNKPGLTASLNQPLYIFTWNAEARTRHRAEAAFASATDTFNSTTLSLRSQAHSFYYDVMQGEETIKVEERKVNSSRKLLDVTQALVQAGKAAPVETMRAKIRTQTDQRQLQNAIVSRDQAVLNAKNFIFWPLDQPIHFTTQLQFKPFRLSAEKLIDYALVHRPELRILRRNQELARLDVQETSETTRPAFAVKGTYGYNDISSQVSHSWSLGGTANWLFFDSFVTDKRVKNSRIAQYVADLNVVEGERNTRVNVRNGFIEVKRAEKQILEFQTSQEQARHNVEVLRLRFQNGLERLIDVFDAENEMRNLDNEYLRLLVNYNKTKDTLSQLIGANVETLQ